MDKTWKRTIFPYQHKDVILGVDSTRFLTVMVVRLTSKQRCVLIEIVLFQNCVSTRRYLDVDLTLFGRRTNVIYNVMDVKTTLCTYYWVVNSK